MVEYLQPQIDLLRRMIAERDAAAKTPAERAMLLDKLHPAQISLSKLLEKEHEFQVASGFLISKDVLIETWNRMTKIIWASVLEECGEYAAQQVIDRIAPQCGEMLAAARN